MRKDRKRRCWAKKVRCIHGEGEIAANTWARQLTEKPNGEYSVRLDKRIFIQIIIFLESRNTIK
jgi:hypothetical protein